MDLKLKDKVAIVTGGGKGIGAGIVMSLASEGAKVVLVDRNQGVSEKLVKQLTDKGLQAYAIIGDLVKDGFCEQIILRTLEKYKQIDILVNNAGKNDSVGIDSSPQKFMDSLYLNIVHCYALVHYALPVLKKRRGTIINISSKVAQTGQGNTSGYAASKGAMNALTREWALDFAKYHIRVNTVVPAEVLTPLYETWLNSLENKEATLKRINHLIPLGNRMTTSEEIADMVTFLASSKSSHTTGQMIYVDGGYTHLDRAYSS